jgi:hypothetical protein
MTITVEQIQDWLSEADEAARIAAAAEYAKNGNSDWGACGFGWVNIYKFCGKNLDGRSKLAKTLKAAGVRQDYTRSFQVWNPGGYGGQNISIKEAAAKAYADVLIRKGFTAYAGSRLD